MKSRRLERGSKLIRWLTLVHGSLALKMIMIQPSSAQVADSLCQGARVNFAKAVTEAQDSLKSYAECVAGSKGSEDCGAEFRRLRTAQGSLETAVMQHRTFCRP